MNISGDDYTDFSAALAESGESMPCLDDILPLAEPAQPDANRLNKAGDRRGIHDHATAGGPRPSLEEKPYDGNAAFMHNMRDELPSWLKHKKEKWEHRICAYLKAQGYSNVEIAAKTGYTPAGIWQIMQLPWVKEVIRTEINKNGQAAVEQLLKASTFDSVCKLLEVRDNPNAQPRDVIAASKELLDRVYGKPNQPITHVEAKDLNALSDQELEAIARSGGVQN